MNDEIWKDIPNYEGLYQASNFGNIRALTFHNNICFKKRIYNLKQQIDKYGRKRVFLSKDNKSKCFQVHRLIAQTFILNPNDLPEVNHIDENPLNNRVDNLEWCTHLYNMQYGTGMKRMGIKHRKRINQYDLSGNFIKTWDSIKGASQGTNISSQVINMCCKGKTKVGKGYRWEYANE